MTPVFAGMRRSNPARLLRLRNAMFTPDGVILPIFQGYFALRFFRLFDICFAMRGKCRKIRLLCDSP
jgi:hypothetical protein